MQQSTYISSISGCNCQTIDVSGSGSFSGTYDLNENKKGNDKPSWRSKDQKNFISYIPESDSWAIGRNEGKNLGGNRLSTDYWRGTNVCPLDLQWYYWNGNSWEVFQNKLSCKMIGLFLL